jgi:hypothetical protein
MLAAFTASIRGKQQKISILLIFSFKSIKFTHSLPRTSAWIAIKMGGGDKMYNAMNLHALPLPSPLAML